MSLELTQEQFADFWADLNREWPPYKISAEEIAKQGNRYFSELRAYSAAALEDSYRAWLRKNDRRPRLSHLLEGCAEYMHRLKAAIDIRGREEVPDHPNFCPCRCQGTRWAMVLLDAQGQARRFPASPAAIGVPNIDAAAQNAIAVRVAGLAGEPMTRDRIECRRQGSDLIPRDTGTFLGRDDRGVPIWTTTRQLEAAA